MKAGDKVRMREGQMVGTILAIREGAWTNGGIPMARVAWEGTFPSEGFVTVTRLETTNESE